MDTQSAIITTCLYQICLLKVSLVGSFKHLPDSRGTQITAYFCMQLAGKSSSLISCIIHGSSQPISVSFRVLKMCKIQRENILKRPIEGIFMLPVSEVLVEVFASPKLVHPMSSNLQHTLDAPTMTYTLLNLNMRFNCVARHTVFQRMCYTLEALWTSWGAKWNSCTFPWD